MTLRPATDASGAQWIVDSLTTFAKNVGSIVPAVFEAYARVFHPAGKRPGPQMDPVRWSDVAMFNIYSKAQRGQHLHAIGLPAGKEPSR